MDKEAQFITLVQTALLSKYISAPGDGTVPMARAMWAIEHMSDAFRVAERIPPDVTATEAAESFVRWMFKQPLEGDDETIFEILIHDI
jgi:hypothetical protein